MGPVFLCFVFGLTSSLCGLQRIGVLKLQPGLRNDMTKQIYDQPKQQEFRY